MYNQKNHTIDNSDQLDVRSYINGIVGITEISSEKSGNLDVKLTQREYEILFLLYLCKSELEIAKCLSKVYETPINSGTIGLIIRNYLYPKFSVHSKSDLVDKVVLMNLIREVPASFVAH